MLPVCYCYKQLEMYGEVSPGLAASTLIQLVYMYKFYIWEMGYMHTMDIQHDRFGFYEAWGCSVWVPVVYTSHSLYLVEHCRDLGPVGGLAIAVLGVYAVFVNYEADWQRQVVRASDAKMSRSQISLANHLAGRGALDDGSGPVAVIRAKYEFHNESTGKTSTKSSILLVDGWWAVSRHFHYLPEITASVAWCLPALGSGAMPYFYPFYLTLLLVDRAFRDDRRCRNKYAKYWDEYCGKVPYLILPKVI